MNRVTEISRKIAAEAVREPWSLQELSRLMRVLCLGYDKRAEPITELVVEGIEAAGWGEMSEWRDTTVLRNRMYRRFASFFTKRECVDPKFWTREAKVGFVTALVIRLRKDSPGLSLEAVLKFCGTRRAIEMRVDEAFPLASYGENAFKLYANIGIQFRKEQQK